MGSYTKIQQKLSGFIRKYFINELIKGSLLFIAIGCVYLLVTLFIENFFWLNTTYRTVLFWLFVAVELLLLWKFILIPIVQLIGLRKGITAHDAAKIIGDFFPEVSDKLVNVIELSANPTKSDLLVASIEQKSKEIQPIPFRNAINFTANRKYLKYTAIPFIIFFGILITGQFKDFTSSLERVVDYKTTYQPPAPFYFSVTSTHLKVLENEDFLLTVKTIGDLQPDDVKMHVAGAVFYMSKQADGSFSFNFEKVRADISFYFEANGVTSEPTTLEVIHTPTIENIAIELQFPNYLNKPTERIENTGNLVIPEGTNVVWNIAANQTVRVAIQFDAEEIIVFDDLEGDFQFSKRILNDVGYKLTTSNKNVQEFDALQFDIATIKDQYPSLIVNAVKDSIGAIGYSFYGQVGDDHGISNFQFVYYDKNDPNSLNINRLDVINPSLSEFYVEFPGLFELEAGVFYECYFEVFDNDGVHGSKSVKSSVYNLYNPTLDEYKEQLLENQKNNLDALDSALEEAVEVDKGLDELQLELQRESELDWNEFQKLEEYLERQEQYENMFEEQTEQLEENIQKTEVGDENKEAKEALLERIEESKKSLKEEAILKELSELYDKLEKEDLAREMQKISKKTKKDQKNLERLLELTKRFYVEQQMNRMKENLGDLAKKLDSLMSSENLEKEIELQEKFNEEVAEENKKLEELSKENSKLKRPMEVPIDAYDMEKLEEMLEDALNELKEGKEEDANTSQKKAKNKMQRMSEQMQNSMQQMQGEQLNENIDDLRIIVENLITFSYLQEDVFDEFKVMESGHPDFAKNLKQQNNLKQFFEHIDDSIYSLSLRVVTMTMDIQNEISDATFNMDQALSNLGDNRFEQGVSNQQFVLTASNNLANMLSDLLDAMMNASMKMGSGEGGEQEFSMPDIIKKQEGLMEKLMEQKGKGKEGEEGEDGNSKGEGEKEGKDGEGNGISDEELFEIYKEQSALKELLKSLNDGEGETDGNGNGDKKAISEMEQLEDLILSKVPVDEILKKMTELKHELLKLDAAKKEQGREEKRESTTNFDGFNRPKTPLNLLPDSMKNYNEILIRQSLPLRSIYKRLVQDYFKEKEE